MIKVIFLDRDGVVNKDIGGYVSRPEDFEFVPGSLGALKKLNLHKYQIMIISNQAGISKGLYSEDDLKRVNNKMLKDVKKAGCYIKSVQYCIHSDEDNCLCRKPKVGLFNQACKGLDIDFKKCFFVGDKISDLEAARRSGCKSILVLSGKAKLSDIAGWQMKPDYIKKDLKEAVDWILENEK